MREFIFISLCVTFFGWGAAVSQASDRPSVRKDRKDSEEKSESVKTRTDPRTPKGTVTGEKLLDPGAIPGQGSGKLGPGAESSMGMGFRFNFGGGSDPKEADGLNDSTDSTDPKSAQKPLRSNRPVMKNQMQ